MGILADQGADGFLKKCPLGLARAQREGGELFTNVYDTTDIDLFEFFTCLTFSGVPTVGVLCIPESFVLFFRRDRRFGFFSFIDPEDHVDIFVARGIGVLIHFISR